MLVGALAVELLPAVAARQACHTWAEAARLAPQCQLPVRQSRAQQLRAPLSRVPLSRVPLSRARTSRAPTSRGRIPIYQQHSPACQPRARQRPKLDQHDLAEMESAAA